tara:strand:- start:1330 stop:1629 length:300 start_codon:yes stop_codon:yes gene_type:complete
MNLELTHNNGEKVHEALKVDTVPTGSLDEPATKTPNAKRRAKAKRRREQLQVWVENVVAEIVDSVPEIARKRREARYAELENRSLSFVISYKMQVSMTL